MARTLTLVICAAAVLALAGCGGAPADRSASAGAPSPAPLTARQKKQVAFRRYLAQTRIANGFYQRGRSISNNVIDEMEGVLIDSAQGRAAGTRERKAAQSSREASVRQRLAAPPATLRVINTRFAQDMEKIARWQDELGAGLRAGDAVGYNTTLADPADIGASVRSEWRSQVTAYARRYKVPMPLWAAEIGTFVK